MPRIEIELTDQEKAYIDIRVGRGDFASAEELIQSVLHKALVEHSREHMCDLIEQGLDSGPATEWTHEDFENKKRALRERFGKGAKAG